jgi:hypothetical protein
MRERVARKLRSNPQLVLFLLAVFALGASNGIFQTTYNNYLDDVFSIGATARGALEFPREFPGFLVAILAGALFFLRESHVAALAATLTGIGLIGLGLVDDRWGWMLVFTVIWSIGQHVEMPGWGRPRRRAWAPRSSAVCWSGWSSTTSATTG